MMTSFLKYLWFGPPPPQFHQYRVSVSVNQPTMANVALNVFLLSLLTWGRPRRGGLPARVLMYSDHVTLWGGGWGSEDRLWIWEGDRNEDTLLFAWWHFHSISAYHNNAEPSVLTSLVPTRWPLLRFSIICLFFWRSSSDKCSLL